ncbi:MAG TPA: GNAT family N-acetyltransferase [Methanothrix sp.]|nr:GNAT family N-acetyltransferase [Methanothrix sp.]
MGVLAIKARKNDTIIEVGYLSSRSASQGAVLKYIIKFLTEDDIQEIINLQDIVLAKIKDSDTYYPVSKEVLKGLLNNGDTAMGVVISEELVGFCIIHLPGLEQGNLGRDIEMSEEDLNTVAHIQFIFVHPDYWGYSIQNKLIKHVLNIVTDAGCRHVLCTISPKNYYSLYNTLQWGFSIREIKEKYGGLLRYILCKNISIDVNPRWHEIVTINRSDIEGQKRLLEEGFQGFDVSKGSDGFIIHYGRGHTRSTSER